MSRVLVQKLLGPRMGSSTPLKALACGREGGRGLRSASGLPGVQAGEVAQRCRRRVLTGQLSPGEAESVRFLDGIADSSPALMSLSSVFVKWVFCLLMGKLRKTVGLKHFSIL